MDPNRRAGRRVFAHVTPTKFRAFNVSRHRVFIFTSRFFFAPPPPRTMTCRQIKLRRVAGDRKWEPAPPPSERRGTRGGVRGEGKERRGTRYKKYLTHLTHYPHRPPFTHTENLPPAIHATYYWGWGGSGTGINKKLPPFSPISCARSCLYLSYLSSIDSITPQPLPEPTFSKPVR